jgi:hypothetical protein
LQAPADRGRSLDADDGEIAVQRQVDEVGHLARAVIADEPASRYRSTTQAKRELSQFSAIAALIAASLPFSPRLSDGFSLQMS